MHRCLVTTLFALAASACVPPAEPRPAPPVEVAPPAPPARLEEAELDGNEARHRADALVETLGLREYGNDAEVRERALGFGLDETLARRLVEAIARPCLAAKDPKAKACSTFDILAHQGDPTLEALVSYLGEIGETRGVTPTVRLLVRLRAVGSTRATMAIEHLLDRRMTTSYAACAPPTPAEIAASAASLADFVVVEASDPPAGSKAPKLSTRAPTPHELEELAYFDAAVVAVRTTPAPVDEDRAAPQLAEGAAAVGARHLLADGMRDALAKGELEEHAALARHYLESLGFPGPIRVAEERDERWGGPGYGYVMRDLALTLELLGRPAEAEVFYRRAKTGGGVCGTSSGTVQRHDMEGRIRTGEAAHGCRAVAAERLFSVALDLRKSYGTRRLAEAGFDVVRLYRAALLTLGRGDPIALKAAFEADPRKGAAALARFEKRGAEDWAAETRAIGGLAAEGRKAAIPTLVALARRGVVADRIEALEALGALVEDHGIDPCLGLAAWGVGSSREEREVPSLMHDCKTKLTPAEADRVSAQIASLAGAREPDLRAAVAVALGRARRPNGRGALVVLGRDGFSPGGQTCRYGDDGAMRCAPTRPVLQAAEDALKNLDDAEARRKEERLHPPAPLGVLD